jgi:predicted enzyme related to lactoylglutathione lyase
VVKVNDVVDAGAAIHSPLADTDAGLRAREIEDPNGYVICLGRP